MSEQQHHTEADRAWTIELHGIEPIPDEERHGSPFELFWVWFAANIGILGIVYGGILAISGLNLWQSILVALVAPAISFLLVGVLSVAGKRGGAPMLTLSRAGSAITCHLDQRPQAGPGRPVKGTVDGVPPTHSELLDWLASDFAEHGWTFKRMHKLIMLSNTYRMSSRGNEAGLKADPANRNSVCNVGLWRWSRHPNYFFEWLCWLAYPLIAIDLAGYNPYGWLALLAPAAGSVETRSMRWVPGFRLLPSATGTPAVRNGAADAARSRKKNAASGSNTAAVPARAMASIPSRVVCSR